MRNTLADYANDDGYEDAQGCWHEDAESLIQVGVLGFCGCGRPDDSLRHVLDGLELIGEKAPDVRSKEWPAWRAGHMMRINAHFKSPGAEYFFYYWCDKEGYTHHGGSVPGYLSDKGRQLLGLLREWRASLPADGPAEAA